jgi:hypothetical protein
MLFAEAVCKSFDGRETPLTLLDAKKPPKVLDYV